MRVIVDQILRKIVQNGRLQVMWPDGGWSRYGNIYEPMVTIQLYGSDTLRHLALNPGLAVGEAYMDGNLQPLDCDIYDLLHLLMHNLSLVERSSRVVSGRRWLRRLLRSVTQANNARRARRNVAHHYDLDGQLYALFLDHDQQYSCAYFPTGDETIDKAQEAKKRHIAAKLLLNRPNLEILDIGCGWGGMALTLAQEYGARVKGITLSEEQLSVARQRAADAGLSDRCHFELIDYREVGQQFDQIVSVGMFEHVGVPNYDSFFASIGRMLKPDGVALLHAIGRFDPPGGTNPWVNKYIFPGGYCPALSEVLAPIERSGLRSLDIEILRLHYAKTLSHWRHRFKVNRETIAALYDERFCRMFEFYLAGSQLAFEVQDHMVFQIQLSHQQDAVPLTRDYIFDCERKHLRREVNQLPS